MGNKMKRFLSTALVLAMLSTNSLTALATESVDSTQVETQAATSVSTEEANTSAAAKNERTGETYESVTDALFTASEGDTVTLLKDEEVSLLSVIDDVTLDLNGHTLKASYVTCFGNIVDQSEDNTGLLQVESKRFLIQEKNEQLPIKTGGGYKFFEVSKFNKAWDKENSRYAFQPFVDQDAHELIMQGTEVTGMTVNVRVSWTQGDGLRTQDFTYTNEMANKFFGSYNSETSKFGQMFTLVLNGTSAFEELTFSAVMVSDTGVEIASDSITVDTKEDTQNPDDTEKPDDTENPGSTGSSDVTTDENNKVTGDVQIEAGQASANVSAGTQLDENTNELKLTVKEMDVSDNTIEVEEKEEVRSVDVHVDGIAENNTVPIIVTVDEFAPEFLNQGNIRLYHVEDGTPVEMTRVFSLEEVDEHNEYYYDPATGVVTMAMATFSEVAVVADTTKAWEGKFYYSWYDASKTELTIANADQLAAFGAIVGGMNADATPGEGDSFKYKTVKLLADINLSDEEENNNSNIIFYPIGYYNSTGSYERESGEAGKDVTSSVSSFEGTFDGNGHTISNFYQNTWEMFGDYNSGYSGTPNYYKDAMGLFGYVYGGTVKNLTVDNFSSDGEFTPTGVIAAYADGDSKFENIAITNCNPRVYNTGNGGIVGIAGDTSTVDDDHLTFSNITVDNSNIISALWGSWDVACGGLVGMYRGNVDGNGNATGDTISFNNCHVSAQIDVYNDVCANYQYYAYRYAGMIIGSVRHNTTNDDEKTIPNMTGISASGCTVNYGDWNDYYYCEFEKNSMASYSEDYQFSRVPHSELNFTDSNGNGVVDADERDSVTGCKHTHTAEENHQAIYLPFHQLFTGYSWGVSSIGIEELEGIENITVAVGDQEESVNKFKAKEVTELSNGVAIKASELFEYVENCDVKVDDKAFYMGITDLDDTDGTVTAVFEAGDTWADSTITLTGKGEIRITAQDYKFCNPCSIEVTVTTERQPEEKFELVFENTDKYLYRVGNAENSPVSLGTLFKAKSGVEIRNVSVTVEALNGAVVSGTYKNNTTDWTKGTIQFSGTGPVKVTITDDDYCIPVILNLEVVNAKNITKAESAVGNNVVLLNDTSGAFTVSNGYTFYGNGFTVTLPTTYQAGYTAGFVGYVYLNNGNLDNVQIEGPTYPVINIYQSQAQNTTTNKEEYFYNSILINGGNCTISNSYISGSRTAVCIRGANNVLIENTTLYGGAFANMQIAAANTVTLRDITTVQKDETDSYGQGVVSHGMGIFVDSSDTNIVVEGELKQYNWLSHEQWKAIVGSYESSFPYFFTNEKYEVYQHIRNGEPYVNLAFVFACDWDSGKLNYEKQANKDIYTTMGDITVNGCNGGVYSVAKQNILTDELYNAPDYFPNKYNPVVPTFKFDNSANHNAKDESNDADEYCVYEEDSGILSIGITGSSKILDLSGVDVTKNGVELDYTAYLNGNEISGNSVTVNSEDGTRQLLTFKFTSDDVGYDKEGEPIDGSIEYEWTIVIEVATLAYPSPVWNMNDDYSFGTENCYYVYYQKSQGYAEAVPIYKDIKVNYYNKNGELVEHDFSKVTNLPTNETQALNTEFTYKMEDGSILTMKPTGSYKSGVATLFFTKYSDLVYIYPSGVDNDSCVRPSKTGYNFDVSINYTFTDPNGMSTEMITVQWYGEKANGESINDVQWKKFDSNHGKEPECIVEGTLITMADGVQKPVEDLAVGDMIKVFNHITGEYEDVPLIFNTHADQNERAEYDVLNLEFSNDEVLKIVSSHGLFDTTLMQYVYVSEDNYKDYIGHEFYALSEDGQSGERVTLENAFVKKEETRIFCPVTYFHMNSFANGFLNTPNIPGDITGLVNYFEYDDDLKYNEEAMQRDIEKYGLYSYEDFKDYISEEAYNSSPAVYLKVSVGKGMITFEEILDVIDYLLEGSLIQ